ncbi:acyl-CoA-binding protein, partial [Radiomyces spectabilis]|uniref:acyl-CoA-binding protein n=1 Tax=Radiomyces spectabilis TaxID=64574 RepID=UPI002220AD51
QLQFTRALSVIGSLLAAGAIQPTASEKLTLYGLYKQATEGDCHLPRPSSRQVGMFAKWRAWDRLRGISPAEAQKYYVDTLLELL